MTANRVLAVALAWSGMACATGGPVRVHPEYAARAAGVRTVGVLRPGVRVVDAGPPPIERPEVAARLQANLLAAVEAGLRSRDLAVKRLSSGTEGDPTELAEVARLEAAVAGAIVEALYVNDFPWKRDRGFDYTVGDVSGLLASEGVDALVFTHGASFRGTLGEVPESVSIAMVDRSGAVIWFTHGESTWTDLRAPENVARWVKYLLDAVPRRRP